MSAEPLQDGPAPPRPAGVVDLGRYRGRTGANPPIAPPPRPDGAPAPEATSRSPIAGALSAPVLVPDWNAPVPAPVEPAPAARPAASPGLDGDTEVVIRRFKLGSVFRMTLGFAVCALLVVLGALILIWVTISTLGVVENLESLAEDLGWDDVTFDGPAMLRAVAIGGAIAAVAATFLSVVFAEVFNLLSTITGGLKAEVGPPPPRRRGRARRAIRPGRR